MRFWTSAAFRWRAPVRIPRLYNGQDRTFFFVSYERSYQGDYITGDSLGSVPTVEQRKGDFSKTFDNSGRLFTIYDPLTGHFEGTSWVRAPFAGNVITPNRFSPVGAKLLNLYPEPNTTTSGSVPWQNNYIAGSNIRDWRPQQPDRPRGSQFRPAPAPDGAMGLERLRSAYE